ncbi:ATP-binding protein [Bacillus cereus group sp. MYBK12-2]|uniref:ATP-binding protein n=1 Tax=Bacillus cereus group sp. MYBK12-2 TaxID=3450689 RepID=UPI003F7A0788
MKNNQVIYDLNHEPGARILERDFFRGAVDPDYAAMWHNVAERCDPCVKRIRTERKMQELLSNSNMSPRFKKRTFETFKGINPAVYKADVKAAAEQLKHDQGVAYRIVTEYCTNFEKHAAEGEGFALFGDPGTGKTHLLAAKTNYLLSKGIQSIHVNTVDLFDEIRSTFETDEKGKPLGEKRQSEIIELMKTCPDLSLDDVGTERPTEWVLEKFYAIINHRYEHMLPTSWNTNCTVEELKQHLGKIYRRLAEPAHGRMALVRGISYDTLQSKKIY